jgi:hypothetical protein
MDGEWKSTPYKDEKPVSYGDAEKDGLLEDAMGRLDSMVGQEKADVQRRQSLV